MREPAINRLYQSLATLMRRRAEISAEVHPDFSLTGYSMLIQIEAVPGTRATDLAELFGLDKSTVSRQLNELEAAGLIQREGERPGRRGQELALTADGRRRLEVEAGKARRHFSDRLSGWKTTEIAAFADMVDRFMEDTADAVMADRGVRPDPGASPRSGPRSPGERRGGAPRRR